MRTMVIPSKQGGLAEPRQWILEQLEENQFSEDDRFAVRLGLEEAFYNAVRHGNKMDPNKSVKIDCMVGPDKIEISMTDAGAGFDPNAVPDCRIGENLYKTEGRGLLLIRSYMDLVEFNRPGNMIHMVRYKHSAGQKKQQRS